MKVGSAQLPLLLACSAFYTGAAVQLGGNLLMKAPSGNTTGAGSTVAPPSDQPDLREIGYEGALDIPNTAVVVEVGDTVQVTCVGSSGNDYTSVNFYDSSGNIIFHWNPRYSEGAVVRNALIGGIWYSEERAGGWPFPVTSAQYTMYFTYTSTAWKTAFRDASSQEYLTGMDYAHKSMALPVTVNAGACPSAHLEITKADYTAIEGKKCVGSSYTFAPPGCDGWSGLTASECWAKCKNNDQAPGCPAGNQCSFAQFYPSTGWCHLYSAEECGTPSDEPTTVVLKAECLTTSDASVGPNVPCVFPWTYLGVEYLGCTATRHTTMWCATSLKEDGTYATWGNCDMSNPACLPAPALQLSTEFDFAGGNNECGGTSEAAAASLPVGNSKYTLEAYVMPDSDVGDGHIVTFGNHGTSLQANGFRFIGGPSTLFNYWWANDLSKPTGVSLADGSWHHVAATYDGTNRCLHADSAELGCDTPGVTLAVTNQNFCVGTLTYFPEQAFKGKIKGLKIWSEPLTTAQMLSAQQWAAPTSTWYLGSDVAWTTCTTDGLACNIDHAYLSSDVINIGGTEYAKGIFAHANSVVKFGLWGNFQTFSACIGIARYTGSNCGVSDGEVTFTVLVDGVQSHLETKASGAASCISVDVTEKMVLELQASQGSGGSCDHSAWGDAKLTVAAVTSSPTVSPTTASPTVSPTASPTTASPTASPTTASPTLSPTASPTTASPTTSPTTASPTSAPTAITVTAIGDPHVTNVRGKKMELHRTGNLTLLQIPKNIMAEGNGGSLLLRVVAHAAQKGPVCSQSYIDSLTLTGKWIKEKFPAGVRRYAVDPKLANPTRHGHKSTLVLGPGIEMVISHGRTDSGIYYLNFRASDLEMVEVPIGGLLGDDDDSNWGEKLPENCGTTL